MHLFLRAVGFNSIDNTTKENKLLRQAIKDAIDNNQVIQVDDKAIINTSFGDGIGLCIRGRYSNSNRFTLEYYFPYLISDCKTSVSDINIERHADKDSYAIVCDDVKASVTLIFYLQNIADYYGFNKNKVAHTTIKLSALSCYGKILLPMQKDDNQIRKIKKDALVRNNLIAQAKNGDEEAIENLTIDEFDVYSQITKRINNEDLYSIIDTTFMPCGIECDQYSVIGEILEVNTTTNTYTGESIYIMTLDCNDVILKTAINAKDLYGEPAIGRRFKGSLWISAHVDFNDN